jgi:excisionase family DNA binding protein
MEKLVYTVHEAAEVLKVGRNKAYEMIQQDMIPYIRVGRRILVPKKALEQWLLSGTGVGA